MDSVKFSEHNLVSSAGALDLTKLKAVTGPRTITDDDGISGFAEIENTEGYLWVYAKCGRNKPYSDDVINVKTAQREMNPRTEDQAELRNQSFFLYIYEDNVMYVSGEISFIKNMLHDLDQGLKVRNVYKTRDEFMESLKQVTKVRLIAKENLFSSGDNIFSIPNNELGLGNPSQVRIELKFPHVKKTEAFKEFFNKKILRGCDDGYISSLVVAGDCESGDRLIESTFNLKKVESSVVVPAVKDDRGMFDPEAVKLGLLSKIR